MAAEEPLTAQPVQPAELTELTQCTCWWTMRDEEWGSGERMEYSDDPDGCPVHEPENQ